MPTKPRSREVARQASAELHRRVECLEGLLSAAPLGLGLLGPDLRYVWVNPLLASVNGSSPEHHIGRTVSAIRPDLGDALEPLLRGILETGEPVPEFVISAQGAEPPGAHPMWKGSVRLLVSTAGDVLGIAMVIEPPLGTGNNPNPASLRPFEEHEQRRYRFLEIFAHELNNALTPLLSAAQMLQRYGAEKPDVVDWAGVSIERQVRQLSNAVNNLLDLSRAALGKLEFSKAKLDLKPVLEAAITPCRQRADNRNQTLRADLPKRGLWILGNAARLEQVLQQLLLDAVTFTPVGGHIELAAALEGRHVVIRIHDTGSGLDPDTLETIFDPFSKADGPGFRKTRGMGVGLALAHRLIALHGGTLHAFSKGPGMGAEFVTRIPALPSTPTENQ